jgi:hypothetical protein
MIRKNFFPVLFTRRCNWSKNPISCRKSKCENFDKKIKTFHSNTFYCQIDDNAISVMYVICTSSKGKKISFTICHLRFSVALPLSLSFFIYLFIYFLCAKKKEWKRHHLNCHGDKFSRIMKMARKQPAKWHSFAISLRVHAFYLAYREF